MNPRLVLTTAVAAACLLAACSDDDTTPTTAAPATGASTAPSTAAGGSITLVAYESWPDTMDEVLAAFTAESGIDVEVVKAGDTGTMVQKAVLTAGRPEGDVMFGVDNTFLSEVVEADVFEPYTARGLADVPSDLTALVPEGEATPIDVGDVCINVDMAWFDEQGTTPPADLEALADPVYRDLLVVEDPASSSPGLAFVLATIVAYGEDGWVGYWERLRDNGVQVVDNWTDAYYGAFSGGGDGTRPIVVSYASSPPAEVVFADPPIDRATTASVDSTCFRQVEFAGVLRGTEHPEEARRLLDFMVAPTFQAALPLNLFVYPANRTVALPPVFTENATVPAAPATMDSATIAANRQAWLETWTDTVLR